MENSTDENRQIDTGVENSHTAVSVFGQGSHFVFLYKKTEKLIAAIYMITDFVKDNEPLKWRIRENALELLSLNTSFATVSLSERLELLKKYQALSLEIVSLSGIAHIGGLISEMNYNVLKIEFEKLTAIINKDENKKANEETVVLNSGFFDREDVLYSPQKPLSKGHSQYLPKIVKSVKSTDNKDDKNDRKTIISKLLSKKNGLNIKDFSQAIRDCSEKTIQRELLSMVASGILKKEGERRWSTYSLAF
ncbi:MAG: hypothetical protein AAB484_02765 [Patescibacteria group bacterium]